MSGAGEERRLGPRSGKTTAITVGTGALGLTAIVGAPATVALCYSEHPHVKGASDPTPNRLDPAGSRWILHPAAQDG